MLEQTDKYSDGEKELLYKLFGGENITLFILRKHLYQFELSKEERKLLQFNQDGLRLLKKIFLPENAPDTPIGWTLNMYQSLKPISGYSLDGALVHIKANDLLIDYITERYKALFPNPIKDNELILESLPLENGALEEEDRFIRMLAYHNICAYIEGRIIEIKSRSNPVPELTPEQLKEKQAKDSTK